MTGPLLRLELPQPVPKGRPRLGAHGHTYTPARTVQAEKTVAWLARNRWKGPVSLIRLGVTIELHLTPGKTGDVDNYAKLILDALQGVVYANDRQVRRLLVERLDAPDSGRERAVVTVWPYSAPVSTTTEGA